MKPEQLRYTKTHEWVAAEPAPAGGTIATVGITAFALEVLTDLVFIELPPVGRRVQAGEPFGQVESVKAVSDLYSPVSGEIVEANTAVPNQLERLAQDPYEFGWLVKIRTGDSAALANLLDYTAYRKQIEEAAKEE